MDHGEIFAAISPRECKLDKNNTFFGSFCEYSSIVNLKEGIGMSMASHGKNGKWQGSVGGLVDAHIDKVWPLVTQSKRLPEWMPMVERCTDIAGNEGLPGYIRVVSGFMFVQKDGERSWIKERLLSMDSSAHYYSYKMEASNVGLDGSINSLKLVDYGDDSTLIEWKFEIDPLEGVCEESIIDYLGFLYKSCINRIEGAIEVAAEQHLTEFE